MTAKRWDWDEVEQTRDPDILPLFAEPAKPAGRERATEIFENQPSKAVVLAALRAEAYNIWQSTNQPVSANDIRPVLAAMNYTGDQRILGAVFNKKGWKPVGRIETGTERHAEFGVTRQTILTYVPRAP